MQKKIVISGYYGFDNFGDEAVLYVLLEHLKNKNCDITVFSKNPKLTAKNYNINTTQTFSLPQIIKTIKNTDILISGGGSLLQDATSKKSLIYYLCILLLAKFFKKKTRWIFK